QSLTNLALALTHKFEVYVITSAFDLNSTVPYTNVYIDKWNDVTLPGGIEPIKVYYSAKKSFNKETFNKLTRAVRPQIVYLNGIFSYRFFLQPLLLLSGNEQIKVVICPR